MSKPYLMTNEPRRELSEERDCRL